jgi:hypothetical protein
MSAATVPAERRRALPTTFLGLDRFELACLLVLVAQAFFVLAALLTKGRPLSGADGLLASDQLQYFAWIRESAHHALIGNPFDLARGDRVFFHPGFFISGLVHNLTGLSIPASYIALWKPVAIAVTFVGALKYVRRLLPCHTAAASHLGSPEWRPSQSSGCGQRHAGLVLALFAVMPASALVAWSGWGGKPREYSFDFISGEMWSGQYLWGYLMTAIAVFTLPLVLLGIERWRRNRRPALLAWSTLGALIVCWLQPWQGATLALIVIGVEGWRWVASIRAARRPGSPERRGEASSSRRERPAWPLLAVLVAVGLPAAYYVALGHFDPSWELAGKSNAAGAQAEWKWPWWAMVLTVGPLALPALLAYRPKVLRASERVPGDSGASRSGDAGASRSGDASPSWQAVAVRIWPLAALVVYLAPVGTFPYHAFQGLALPLGILAVQGVVSVWRRPKTWIVAAALLLMTVPGFIHKVQVSANSIHTAGDPFFVFPGEVQGLKALESDRRAGGVLGPTYAGYMIPYRTGRETYIGPFSWTPSWKERERLSDGLFAGTLKGAAARSFVRSTSARWLFEDCRPGLADLEPELRPVLASVRHFGCATVYELRFRPEMARVAGAPDS